MAEVIFVGTGPALTPHGRGNMAFVVRDGPHTLLCECGPVILEGLQRAGVDPATIDTVFVSHRHGDHSLGFPMLILHRMIAARERPLRVVAGRSLRGILSELVQLVYPETAETLAHVEWLELDERLPNEVPLYDGVHLVAQLVCGPDDVPVLGMRLDLASGASLTYSGDTSACEPVARLARGCDLLIHESNFSARIDPAVDAKFYGHSTARQAATAAQQAGVSTLALVHLSSLYAGREEEVAQEAREVFAGRVLVPRDGDVLPL